MTDLQIEKRKALNAARRYYNETGQIGSVTISVRNSNDRFDTYLYQYDPTGDILIQDRAQ